MLVERRGRERLALDATQCGALAPGVMKAPALSASGTVDAVA